MMRVIARGIFVAALVLAAALPLTGCQTVANTAASAEPAAPASYLPPVSPRAAGSLWAADRHLRLYEDQRARQVGDVITVNIVDQASATKEANTTSDRETSVDAGLNALFGMQMKASGNFDPNTMFKAATTQKFQGKGKTDRKSNITASVACRVVQVLPSGNLHIKGSHYSEVNREKQYINVEGVVRTADVSPNNVVLSTNLADARISYSGSGPVTDNQRPGWFTRLMNFLWPF